jgi:hypothetical protein
MRSMTNTNFSCKAGGGEGGVGEAVVFATLGNPAFDGMTWRSVLCFLSGAAPKPGSHREFPIGGGMLRLSRTFEGVRLTALDFRLESRPSFYYITEFMNKRPPAKKPQAKTQTVKKQIPVKKIAPDRIEELVKKHIGNIGVAENAFKSASALLEKHKTKYPELEQYIEHVSASDRSIQILEDIKDPRRAHYIFKILLAGVEPAYQVAHPGEKDHTSVDRAAWISTFEEALAKAIVQIVLSRQAEQASQAVGSPKE